jgi:hypothetical protein
MDDRLRYACGITYICESFVVRKRERNGKWNSAVSPFLLFAAAGLLAAHGTALGGCALGKARGAGA